MYIKYAEMEIRLKNVNHARNIWDRAVAILPRMDQLWYKFVFMEEALGNIAGARQVFERWMGTLARPPWRLELAANAQRADDIRAARLGLFPFTRMAAGRARVDGVHQNGEALR